MLTTHTFPSPTCITHRPKLVKECVCSYPRTEKQTTNAQHQLPISAAAVVFGGYLSARAVFRFDPEYSGPAIRLCVQLPTLALRLYASTEALLNRK